MLRINFGFDLIFSVIREEAEGKKMGKALGIAFERFEQGLTLKSEESDRTLAWRDVLGVKLNQRGFHELFKPIKKIGKGNFATVYLVHKNENALKYAVKAFSKEAAYSEENGKESLINEI